MLSIEKIESLAPDQASLSAAVKIKPVAWQVAAIDTTKEFAWGECQGSGSTPYRVCLQLSDLGYKCTCPSRKFPCKHSLGLMLLLAKSPQNFGEAQTPDWVKDWASRRRGGTTSFKPNKVESEDDDDDEEVKVSLAQALQAPEPKPRDEKAEARAAQQRERLKAQREESILAGLDELDRWIEDSLSRGLAGFMGEAAQRCRTLAQRLVDAKAPALATSIDALPSMIMALPESMRTDALIETLGEYHLLAEAYRRQDKLPEALRHDVRRLVGWTQERQALLDDANALRVTATWTVVATHVEVQPDKLRRIETWLMGEREGKSVPAVLIDFVPVATAATGSTFQAGELFAGELVFYPSAAPLRAIIARRENTAAADVAPTAQQMSQALEAYDECCAVQPWLGQWPMTIAGPSCHRYEKGGIWITAGGDGIPVSPRLRDEVVILSGVDMQSMTGLWDGRFFAPSIAETSLGRWIK